MKEEWKKENEENKEEENRRENGWMYRLIEPFRRCRDNREKFFLRLWEKPEVFLKS